MNGKIFGEKQGMRKKSAILLMLSLSLITFSLLTACGKYGDPQPEKSMRSFDWEKVNITPAYVNLSAPVNDCLDVTALMTGVYTNLDSVILELANIDKPEDCSDCPFRPTESYILDNLSQAFNRQSGTLNFSYCPGKQSKAYRARIIGTNIYNTARHAVSPEQMVVMP
jgi:hypothetical protein